MRPPAHPPIEDLIGDDEPQGKAVEPPGVMVRMSREERLDEFIRQLSEGAKVRAAAANVGLGYANLYALKKKDPAFAARWDEATKLSIPKLEGEAWRRAMAGSDKLLMFVLERRASHLYGAKQSIDHTSSDGSMTPAQGTHEERVAKVEALLAVAKARKESKSGTSIEGLI